MRVSLWKSKEKPCPFRLESKVFHELIIYFKNLFLIFAEKAFKHCIPENLGIASAQILVSKYIRTKRNQSFSEKRPLPGLGKESTR